MAVQSKAWEHVGAKFDSLGAHLRSRFDEVGADAAADRAAFEKSLRTLLSALEETLSAAGNVVRDPVLRRDLSDLAASVRKALTSSFESAGEQLRERLAAPVRRARPAVDRKHASARKATATKAPQKATAHKTTAHKTTAHKTTAHKAAPRAAAPKAAPRKRASSTH